MSDDMIQSLYRQVAKLESQNELLEEELAMRKRVDEARDRIASIFESSDDAIYTCSLQGVVTGWNKAAQRLYGYAVREILGRDAACLASQYESKHLRDLHEKIAKRERVVSFECQRITRDGRAIDVSMTWSPLFDLRNRLAGYSVISRDISQRIALDRELANYREHLERLVAERTRELVAIKEKTLQAERLASIGALAAGIAHEINNPIGAMLLAAQNALEGKTGLETVSELSSALDRLAKKILVNAERCGLIVRGVLQFARRQATEKWPCDINLIVRDSIELMQEVVASSRAKVVLELAPHIPALKVNPLEIEQIIVNLVKNACQAGDKLLVKVSTNRTSTGLRLIVEDNGKGIPEAQRAHIFDPFFTTRLERGGTGLGLSIVHGIVAGYGGTIEVHSELGVGTKIVVELPFGHRRGRPSEAAGEVVSSPTSKRA